MSTYYEEHKESITKRVEAYRKSLNGRAKIKARQQSAHGKAVRKAYDQKPKAQAYLKKYRRSPERMMAAELYRNTARSKASRAAYWAKPENRRRLYEAKLARKKHCEIIEPVNKELLIFSHQGRCVYCGKDIKNDRHTHIDHMIPVSRYGKRGKKFPYKYSTVVPSCAPCNIRKKDRTPLEFMWQENLQEVI